MAIEITRPGKNSLQVETPVMPAAGVMGFGDDYKNLIKFEKLGAFVTNPITYRPWRPATGTRVVPMDGGMLVHTGLPGRGLTTTLDEYRMTWDSIKIPVIVHLVATRIEDVRSAANMLDNEDVVDAIELGLHDDFDWQETKRFVQVACDNTEKPVLARLPFQNAEELVTAAIEGDADALVLTGPPRGTARDPISGKLVSGRIYGPLVKPMVLRLVGHLVRHVEIPIIACGGIHSGEDARDFIEAGARAVQVDSATWLQPKVLEIIARDLGGLVLTRPADAMPDEWSPGMGTTLRKKRQRDHGASDAENPA